MALETKKQSVGKYLILALIPFIVFAGATTAIVFSKNAEVVKNSGFKRDGYPDVPTTYQVTASPHKVYADFWSDLGVVVVIGWIAAVILTPLYVYGMNKAAKQPSFIIIALFWASGLFLAFGFYAAKRYTRDYTRILTEKEYNAAASNLDGLF